MAARLTAYIVALIVGTTFIAGLIVGAQRDDEGPVDVMVVNGRVYTADGQGTMAEAVAIQGNKIIRVGTSSEIRRLRRAQTVVIDAKGGAVMPGFIDGHAHLLSGALSASQVDLLHARTLVEIQDTVRLWAATHADQQWVAGRGWSYTPFAGALPTRQQLDEIVPDRPAYLTARDGHTGWANTAALELAGITRRTRNPLDGVVVKDPKTGEPTGVLKEAAMGLVTSLMPQPSRADQLSALRAATIELHRRGVTGVHNTSSSAAELGLYDELRRDGALSVRVYSALSLGTDASAAELAAFDELRTTYADDPLLKAGAVKIVVDGAIESQTAALLAPYAGKTASSGEARFTATTLNRIVAELDRRGWQIMIHAAGDRAVRMALDAYRYAAEVNAVPARERRHRIEHVETIDPADVARFGALRITASMQPAVGLPDANQLAFWTTTLGGERAARAWPYGSIARSGSRLLFGSDWPMGTLDPILGLHVAVNRTAPDGEPADGWNASERVRLQDAIDAYTRNAAWASFDEHRKGTLARDMLADVVVLTKDIFALPPHRVTEAEVAVTIFDGKVVFQRTAETDD